MKIRQAGFTLIELMVVVAIAAVLASMAVPSFRTLLSKRAATAAADSLVSDMTLARSEALKRSAAATVCRSTDGLKCSAAGGSWHVGWLVFVDVNANGTNLDAGGAVDPGDTVIRVQQELSGISTIQEDATTSARPFVRFDPNGRARGMNQTFNVTPSGAATTGATGTTRLVCISITGRPSLRAAGATSCL